MFTRIFSNLCPVTLPAQPIKSYIEVINKIHNPSTKNAYFYYGAPDEHLLTIAKYYNKENWIKYAELSPSLRSAYREQLYQTDTFSPPPPRKVAVRPVNQVKGNLVQQYLIASICVLISLSLLAFAVALTVQ